MKSSKKKIVIIDRDGVINNHKKPYVINCRQFRIIKNSFRGIYKLHKNKFLIAIATNQSCVSRRIISKNILNKIHSTLTKNLKKIGVKLYQISVCMHHPIQNCKCRKPKAGLIDQILKKNNYLYNQKWIIGDNISDLTAGHKLGLNLILVKTGLGLEMSKKLYDTGLKPYTHVCEDLNDAADLILKKNSNISHK